MARKGAMNKEPMKRVSPGMYRNVKGELVRKSPNVAKPTKQTMSPQKPSVPGAQNIAEQIMQNTTTPLQQMPNLQNRVDPRQQFQQQQIGAQENQMPMDKMYRWSQAPQMPQASPEEADMQIPVGGGFMGNPNYYSEQGQSPMPMDKMYRFPQMPQPSANMGGQYRLSPGIYGNKQQAVNQYNQQMQQMGFQNAAQGVSDMPYRPIAMPQVRKG